MTSPITYPGSKRRVVGRLLEHMPPPQQTGLVISPFLGGGSFELALASRGYQVIAGDINPALINFWNVLHHKRSQLIQEIKNLPPITQAGCNNMRTYLLNYCNRDDAFKQPNAKYAAVYFVINRCSWNSLGLKASAVRCQAFDKSKPRLLNRLSKFEWPPTFEVVFMDAQHLLRRYPNAFVFADPPYVTNSPRASVYGLHQGTEFHRGFDHAGFAALLKQRKGLLTYNAHPAVAELYSGYPRYSYALSTRFKKAAGHQGYNQEWIIILN